MSEPNSSVDVGIPVAGRSRFVAEAIESVLAQTVADWRLWVSADGPLTDEIRTAVEPYLGDARIRYSATERRVGAPANKTGLIRSGTAPYVALLDDDDLWKPWFLERQLEFLDEHPDAAFVFCANDVVDGSGKVNGRSRAALPEGVYRPEDFVPYLLEHNPIATPTAVVRRTAYESVGAEFDSRLQTNYDYDMWIRLAVRWPVGYRRSWDATYRHHSGQATIEQRSWRAREMLLLLDNATGYLAAAPERIGVSDDFVRRERARWLLSSALNEVEIGDARAARRQALSAVRLSRRAVKDPKFALALGTSLCGARGARALTSMRTLNLRHGLIGGKLERGHHRLLRRLARRSVPPARFSR
ncbi:MAG: hypothetical protein QOH13_1544 [Thermoleophilaceae bacterium]|nr:hypothetical protein [Thermoleophilaceae bacterium]